MSLGILATLDLRRDEDRQESEHDEEVHVRGRRLEEEEVGGEVTDQGQDERRAREAFLVALAFQGQAPAE